MSSSDISSPTGNPYIADQSGRSTIRKFLRRLWSWISGLGGIVGFASFAEDLQVIIDSFRWVLAQIIPFFAMLLESIWQVLAALIALYRHSLYPFIDALFSWLPFTLSDPMRDGLFISMFSLGWALRYRRWAGRSLIALKETLPGRSGPVSARAKQLAPKKIRDLPHAEIRAWYRAQLAQAPKNLLFGTAAVFGSVALILSGLWVLDFMYRALV